MGCYSVIQREEILTHVTMQMSLEDTVLSEIDQSQKTV